MQILKRQFDASQPGRAIGTTLVPVALRLTFVAGKRAITTFEPGLVPESPDFSLRAECMYTFPWYACLQSECTLRACFRSES
jgi:hypothetical protein